MNDDQKSILRGIADGKVIEVFYRGLWAPVSAGTALSLVISDRFKMRVQPKRVYTKAYYSHQALRDLGYVPTPDQDIAHLDFDYVAIFEDVNKTLVSIEEVKKENTNE
jgi:hypothetical protein